MTTTEQQRSIEYLAGRPGAPAQAKPYWEPSVWELLRVHPRNAPYPEPVPRWVRCSDRLPAPGVYSLRHRNSLHEAPYRHFNGAQWSFACDLEDHQWGAGLGKNYEWLDEAPAQEAREAGQGVEVTEGSVAGNSALCEAQSKEPSAPPSVAHPIGYEGRAQRHQLAEAERVAEKMTFFNRFGRYSPF